MNCLYIDVYGLNVYVHANTHSSLMSKETEDIDTVMCNFNIKMGQRWDSDGRKEMNRMWNKVRHYSGGWITA